MPGKILFSLSLSLSLSSFTLSVFLHFNFTPSLSALIFRGGVKNLGKPELMKVMQRRKVDADGKPGPIKANRASSAANSNCEGELAAQLARRTQIINDVS